MVGKTIGRYKIVEKLGEGGMGVVYKAEDTRLGRAVALKFLASHLLGEGEVKARFEREARAAAALDHPNLCTVFEIDEADGRTFIAMAFLEGESLDKIIARGPLKLEQALDIAQQLIGGLGAAHRAGVVHRDVKPQNIIAGPDSRVTVMDFGLALLADQSRLTKEASSIGTPLYMAPEQAEGADADARADVWSVGVVLYEMIAGRPPFQGNYDQAIVYSILNEEPEPLTGVRTGVPQGLELAVAKCLRKRPEERYQSVAELAVDLKSSEKGREAAAAPARPARRGPGRERAWKGATALATLAAIVFAALWFTGGGGEPGPVRRYSYEHHAPIDSAQISPDGSAIAYESQGELWVQDRDQERARRLAEARDVRTPFWSPDSETIGYVGEGAVWRIPAAGGEPLRVCRVPLFQRSAYLELGGAWTSDGKWIVFSSSNETNWSTLYRVEAGGGDAVVIQENPEGPHFRYPQTVASRPELITAVVSHTAAARGVGTFHLERGSVGRIDYFSDAAEAGGRAKQWFAAPDVLLLSNGAELRAMYFDPESPNEAGAASVVTQRASFPSVSRDGTLVFGRESMSQVLAWRDRSGKTLERFGRAQRMQRPFAAPDGRSVVVVASEGGRRDVWRHLVGGSSAERITFGEGVHMDPVFSWDGRSIAFSRGQSGSPHLLVRPVDGSSDPEVIAEGENMLAAGDWPESGLIFAELTTGMAGANLYRLEEADGVYERKVVKLNAGAPKVHPSGEWVAYAADDSGRLEVYVQRYPEPADRQQVTFEGGFQVQWSPLGDELFFVRDKTVWVVAVEVGESFDVASDPEPLFELPVFRGSNPPDYDVGGQGDRILVMEPAEDEERSSHKLYVVENWRAELEGRY